MPYPDNKAAETIVCSFLLYAVTVDSIKVKVKGKPGSLRPGRAPRMTRKLNKTIEE